MRIVTLMENTTCNPELTWEHGLSLYIELGETKILFDAGESGAFADNAQKLGIDLSQIDFAVLSHGHSDHSGGLLRFLELNDRAPIYASRYAFDGQCNAAGDYIGPDPRLQGRLGFYGERLELTPDILLECPAEKFGAIALDTAGLQRREDGKLIPEDFRHEQYLQLRENGKSVLFSGCSHRGVINIAEKYRPDVLIGGFHFMKREPESLTPEATALLALPTEYYTGHCTGESQYEFLKKLMGDRLHYLPTGAELEL